MAKRKRTSVVWEFFELMDERKKVKKAVCKLCDGLRLVYAGGTTNLLSHLETQHSVDYKKTVPSETSTKKKQATLTSFQAKSCPPGWASAITNLVAELCAATCVTYIWLLIC